MTISVTPSGQACGATVRGVDLTAELDPTMMAAIRSAWLEHHVLAFPDQAMDDDDLERFTLAFGPFGDDPFIAPIDGRDHIIEIRRAADETAPLFAENWHSDWSFQHRPPDGTCLMAVTVPPTGGDTLFADQHLALAALQSDQPDLWAEVEGRVAIHSARGGYAPDGFYGVDDQAAGRAMAIRPSTDAMATQRHPLVRTHPETGLDALYSCFGYIIALEARDQGDVGAGGTGDGHRIDPYGAELLQQLYRWQSREEFVYRHRWEPNMVIVWDNRSLLHRATGGYDGHDRLLHRTTIGGNADVVPAV